MKVLIPVDASKAALAPVEHLAALKRSGVPIEALVLNVQPRFHRHVAQFTSRVVSAFVRFGRCGRAATQAFKNRLGGAARRDRRVGISESAD